MGSQAKSFHSHVFAAAMTSGVFLAMASQILFARYGLNLTDIWRGVFNDAGVQLRVALAWWGSSSIAFIGSFAIAATAKRFAWHRFPRLYWIVTGIFVLGLADAGHQTPLVEALVASKNVLNIFIALMTAMIMAGFGALCAAQRQSRMF